MNPERLKCYENCPFRKTSLIRPCADEVFEENSVCLENIKTDPALAKFGNITPYAGMDELMNHQVEIQKSVENEKGVPKKIFVANVSFGAITFQS